MFLGRYSPFVTLLLSESMDSFMLHSRQLAFSYFDTVRATPKSNSMDNMWALQGDATVLEDAIKL